MRKIHVFWTSMFCLTVCQSTQAQELRKDSTDMAVLLDAVQVTGYKTNQHNLTAASVSTMGNWQLSNQLVSQVSDLSAILPNFFVPEYGSRQTTPIIVRGIYSKVKGTAVGFYVDGIPHFETSSFDMDMLDIKAIEVFRGPQGTLYGRNTLGGVINVYTYNPLEYQGTKFKVGYGNYNNSKVQFSNHAKLSKQVGLSIGGYYEHRDGYFTNEYTSEKADKLNAGGGKLNLIYTPAEKWTIRLSSAVDYTNQLGYAYAPYHVETGTASPVNYNLPSSYKRTLSTNGLNINYKTNNFSLNSQTCFQYIHDDQVIDQDFTAKDVYAVTNGVTQRVFSQELTLKSENDSRFQWVAGTFLFNQAQVQDQGTDYLTKGYQQWAHYESPLKGAALFAQGSYNLWKGLSATVGLRLDYEHASMDYSREQLTHADGSQKHIFDFQSTQNFTELIPKFGLQYKLNDYNQVFANLTQGYKAGGFNQSFEKESERSYQPETNWNYELGAKWGTANQVFSGDATLFYIDWRNQHVSRTVTGLGNVINNAGHSNSKGIEVGLNLRPLPGMLLRANYGYTYAQFLDYQKSDQVNYAGKMTPMVPRNTLSLHASYTITPHRGVDAISLSAGMNGVGKIYWLEDNEVCQPFYLLPDARVELTKGWFNFALWGKNLSNTEYISYYFVSSAKYAQKGVPFTCGAEITLKF